MSSTNAPPCLHDFLLKKVNQEVILQRLNETSINVISSTLYIERLMKIISEHVQMDQTEKLALSQSAMQLNVKNRELFQFLRAYITLALADYNNRQPDIVTFNELIVGLICSLILTRLLLNTY